MTDEKPVDASIRPVLPSRRAADALNQELGLPAGTPPVPSNVTVRRNRKPNAAFGGPAPGKVLVTVAGQSNRSAIAKEAWKKRRANAEKASYHQPAGRFTPKVYELIGELMALDKPARDLVFIVVKELQK